ncbi:MAG: molybdate transport system permease protein [Phenylobacterium sp.]
MLSAIDQQALWVTIKLATATTVILLLLGTPLAWWLAKFKGRLKPLIEALIALPLILPPTVLGFYLLIAFSPQNLPGQWFASLTSQSLAFSFYGILIGSVIYSLPFVVQPLQNAFSQLGTEFEEAAAVLGAGPLDRFFNLVLPLTQKSFITAATLGFAHTVGEFGVVLMIGGNIPGETQVLSIALFDHVEALEYSEAHTLALGLVVFSVITLTLINSINRKGGSRVIG